MLNLPPVKDISGVWKVRIMRKEKIKNGISCAAGSHYRLTHLQHLAHKRLGLFSSRIEILSSLKIKKNTKFNRQKKKQVSKNNYTNLLEADLEIRHVRPKFLGHLVSLMIKC